MRSGIRAAVLLAGVVGCAAEARRVIPPPTPPRALLVEELNALPAEARGARPVDLAPARWIWFPSGRTLQNTFVLFRREVDLPRPPRRALAWITADSRYRLTVNGRFVQSGPAPSDPRWPDVDPVDLAPFLRPGRNVLGVEVLYFGAGDGAWISGKPGLLFHLPLEFESGLVERVLSDRSWSAFLDRAHRPGQFKRWYLRALQEEFDARLHPEGWDLPGFAAGGSWVPAMELEGSAARPSINLRYPDYLEDRTSNAPGTFLRAREIPALKLEKVPARRLARSARVRWKRDPRDWFEFRVPDSFEVAPESAAAPSGDGWELPATPDPASGIAVTFEFDEQVVGHPCFEIDAPEGTVIDLMVQESHDPSRAAWLDTHFFAWSKFVCREGRNRFETFDYEALRWVQIHVRNSARPVRVRDVGVVRRRYDWPRVPRVKVAEPALDRLMGACLNTIRLSCQETVVDGMGRERQQYCGDVGHQLHAVRGLFGETRLPRRFLRTFSEGITIEGWFMDTWPGIDRLVRVPQRQLGTAPLGPILDHGIAFAFDAWDHYLETGDLDALREPWPRIVRFAETLEGFRKEDGLLPVENLGIPTVWMDRRECYPKQRLKQCAFNLYAAAGYSRILPSLARAFGEPSLAERYEDIGRRLLSATVAKFWEPARRLFVANLPWIREDGGIRLCDRSLATAALFDQCPGGDVEASLKALETRPPEMGVAFPANACWRYWALSRWGRAATAIREFREEWATLPSVVLNNSIQETWQIRSDTTDEWSHAGVVPLYVLFMDLAGIRPLAPGWTRYAVRPQLGDLGDVDLEVQTPRGPIHFTAERQGDGHRVTIVTPPEGDGELLLSGAHDVRLERVGEDSFLGLTRYRLPKETSISFPIK